MRDNFETWKVIIENSGLFDKEYYLKENPDIIENQIDPLYHFWKYGRVEQRRYHKDCEAKRPNLWDAQNYAEVYKIIKGEELGLRQNRGNSQVAGAYSANAGANDIAQFLRSNPDLFDEAYYRETYFPSLGKNENAIIHYLSKGWLSGANPSKYFDTNWYLKVYNDVKDSGANPLKHYIENGKNEGRCKNANEFYEQLIGQTGVALPATFVPQHYRMLNNDLAHIKDDFFLTKHFLEQGYAENREYFLFNAAFYKALYDLDDLSYDEALQDYLTNGRNKRRFASLYELVLSYGQEIGDWVRIYNENKPPFSEFGKNKEKGLLAFLQKGGKLYEINNLSGRGNAQIDVRSFMKGLGLNLTEYPSGFDYKKYAKFAHISASSKWYALEHMVRNIADNGYDITILPEELLANIAVLYSLLNDNFAIKIYNHLYSHYKLTAETLHNFGDSLLRVGAFEKAMGLYSEALAAGNNNIWSYLNISNCLEHLGQYKEAADCLIERRGEFGQVYEFRRRVINSLSRYWGNQCEIARRELESEGFDKATHTQREMLEYVEKSIGLTTGTWLRAPRKNKVQKVVMLANTDLRQCNHYRVEQKKQYFEEAGFEIVVFETSEFEKFIQELINCDLAVFYRNPATVGVIRAIVEARKLGIPTIYDIDDLIFDKELYPQPLATYGKNITQNDYYGLQFGVELFRYAMSMCDFGMASTIPLAHFVEANVRMKKCFLLRNGLDLRNEEFLKSTGVKSKQDKSIRIFYGSGTLSHDVDFKTIAEDALISALKKYDNVKLRLVGHININNDDDSLINRIEKVGFVPDAMKYWAAHLADCDINIAILDRDEVTDCKSEIKWLEAAQFAIPSVVSETQNYLDVIDNYKDAIIIKSGDDLVAALERLINNASLRHEIGVAARQKAIKKYGIAVQAENVKNIAAEALALYDANIRGSNIDAPANLNKKKILMVNVFAPPQTIGGATRVFKSNVDDIREIDGNKNFEFSMFSSDESVPFPYLWRYDDYDGMNVYRISTPLEVRMDWRFENAEIQKPFKDLLEYEKPDLIHFHCIQRLTSSCIDAAEELGIPYIVTIHDAWWLSDYQFLTDEDGAVDTVPGITIPPPEGVDATASRLRKFVLRSKLNRAQKVLIVSKAFEKIYKDSGIEHTLTCENGIGNFEKFPKDTGSSKVVLAHIGGMSAHKGFDLVKAVFEKNSFKNLELIVVDHAKHAGSEDIVNWGNTAVRIIGKTSQNEVGKLYSKFNVLLAPSIWPESYGLVSREALASGSWVVASDIGAIGENVSEGENGHIVKANDEDDLCQIIKMIDKNPEKYKASPIFAPPLRSSKEQAQQLLAIYQELLAK